jgi:hypothetical protein
MDGLTRIRRPRRSILFAWAVLLAPPLFAATPQLTISPLGYRIEQITPVAGQTRTYEVTARAGVTNAGGEALAVVAQLTSSTQEVQVLDGQIAFGNVPRTSPFRPAISLDTFRLRIVLPRSRSVLALLQFVHETVEALVWRVDCGNCGAVNRPPVAHAGAGQTAFVGQRITLDGSGSSDPDGQPLQFAWALVSAPTGSSAVLIDATSMRPALVPDREGVYVVRLFVSDGIDVSAASTVTITTVNSAPVAQAGADQTVHTGARVRLDGAA